MKKSLLLMTLIVLCFGTVAKAEVSLYETDDLKIGVSDVSVYALWDANYDEVLPGIGVSLIQFHRWNIDLGFVGRDDVDNLDGDIDIFFGASYDIKAFELKENIYSSVGLFYSPEWTASKKRYGIYGAIVVSF